MYNEFAEAFVKSLGKTTAALLVCGVVGGSYYLHSTSNFNMNQYFIQKKVKKEEFAQTDVSEVKDEIQLEEVHEKDFKSLFDQKNPNENWRVFI